MTRVNREEIMLRSKRARIAGRIGLLAGLAIILLWRVGLEWMVHQAKASQIDKRVAFFALVGGFALFPLLILLMVWLYRQGAARGAVRCSKCNEPFFGSRVDLLFASSRCPCCGTKMEVHGAPTSPCKNRGSYQLLDRRQFGRPVPHKGFFAVLLTSVAAWILPMVLGVFGVRINGLWILVGFVVFFVGLIIALQMQTAANKRRGIITEPSACPCCQKRLPAQYAAATGRCLHCGEVVVGPDAERDRFPERGTGNRHKTGRCCPSTRAELASFGIRAAQIENGVFVACMGLAWGLLTTGLALRPFAGAAWSFRVTGCSILMIFIGMPIAAWCGQRWITRNLKVFCPACGESLLMKSTNVSVATGRCWHCGVRIFDENDP